MVQVRKKGSPTWDGFELSMSQLCNVAFDQQLRLEALHWRGSYKEATLLGAVSTCARGLKAAADVKQPLPLCSPQPGKAPPELVVSQFAVQSRSTFLDYIEGMVPLYTSSCCISS